MVRGAGERPALRLRRCGRVPRRSRVAWFGAGSVPVGAASGAQRLSGARLARGASEAAAVG